MSGPSAKPGPTLPLAPVLLILAAALLSPGAAHARKHNFITGSPFAMGFSAGAEQVPKTAFAAGTPRSDSSYSHYFLFQPQFDFLNVVLQGYFGWHFYPAISGSGSDTAGNFVETSNSGNMSYGARVLLAPWISRDLTRRGYIALGLGMASAKLKNTRSYRNTNGDTTNTYSESVNGSGLEMQAGLGVEVMALQNYSLSLEAGYAQRNINGFKLSGTSDITGAARTDGAESLDANGRKKGFHVWSPYVQLGFTLHL